MHLLHGRLGNSDRYTESERVRKNNAGRQVSILKSAKFLQCEINWSVSVEGEEKTMTSIAHYLSVCTIVIFLFI